MIRHDQLWPFVNSIITENEIGTIALNDSEKQQAMKVYRQRHNLGTAQDIESHCKKRGFTKDQLEWQIQLQEKIIRCSKKKFANKAELHYLTRKEQFDQVSYSQLIVKNNYFAQEIYLRLKEDGASFSELAEELNNQPNRKIQYQIGPVPLARVPKALAKPLKSIKPGTLLEPIKVMDNWFVVQLNQYQPTEFDEAMEQRMCLELFQQHVNKLAEDQIVILSEVFTNSTITPAS